MQESEARYRSLFEDSPFPIWEEDWSQLKEYFQKLSEEGVTDFRHYFHDHLQAVRDCLARIKILNVNTALVDFFRGKSKEAMIGGWPGSITDESLEVFCDEFAAFAEGQKNYEHEDIALTEEGETKNVIFHVGVVHGFEESMGKVLVTVMDITDRKRAEKALIESERRYRSLFEDSPISLWEEDWSKAKEYFENLRADGVRDFQRYFKDHPEALTKCLALIKIIDLNKTAMEFYGIRNKDDALGNLADIVSSESLDVLRSEVAAIASGELYYESEDIARLPGGEKRYNLFRLGVVRGHENSLDKVLFSLLDIHERKQAEEELRQRNRELSAASEILRTATTHLDLQVILDETLRGAVRLANMDSGSICLVVPERKELKLTASYNYADGKMELQPRSDIDHQLCNRVLKTGEFLIQDSDANIVTAGIPTGRKFFHAMFPMKVKEQTIGILCIFSESNNRPTGRSLELLKDLCGPIALAIENARLLSNLQRTNKELFRAYDTTLEGWAKALELRDKETEGHARRVVDLTLELAHRMKVRKADLTNIRRGILLHDIGKMGIPDNVLHKPGPLDASEWREMRQHPLYAYKLLHSINYLHPALDIPLYHHERWDGSGYPYGLKGEKIPVAARMFAVVDVWDALRSDRSYRKAWPKKKVLKYLRDEAGTRFDPNVVKSFLAMLTERRSM